MVRITPIYKPWKGHLGNNPILAGLTTRYAPESPKLVFVFFRWLVADSTMGFITMKTHHLLGILCILSNHRTSKSKHLGEFLLEKKWVGNCRSSFQSGLLPKGWLLREIFWLDEHFSRDGMMDFMFNHTMWHHGPWRSCLANKKNRDLFCRFSKT